MKNNNLNFAFWGTPDVASNTLEILKKNGYIPSVIITSPDSRSGRGLHLFPTQVTLWAEKNNIPCLKPEKIDSNFTETINMALPRGSTQVDLYVVVAYGKILPEKIISQPKLGTINIHYSLLPKYRGASPLEQALLNGDSVTGVSIQQMAYKLDSGPIIKDQEVPIDINETKADLRSKLIKIGAELLCQTLPKIINREINLKIQDESQATLCTKIKKEDGQINPNGNAEENWNKYRAFCGWPGVFFFKEINGKKTRIKITKAIYQNNSFVIERVIQEGKKEVEYSDFLK